MQYLWSYSTAVSLLLIASFIGGSLASKSSSSVQAAAAAASAASYGHQISIVNITDFLTDLTKRLQFVMGAYQSNRINKSVLASVQSSSFVIAVTKPPATLDANQLHSQSFQAVMYVVAVLMCYAAAICAMVVFNFKERKSQAKYEAYEELKKPRNYLYQYFREKYKDPSTVKSLGRKKSSSSALPTDSANSNNPATSSKGLSHKNNSASQLLQSGNPNRNVNLPLTYKISICSTDTSVTNNDVSSPTTPMSYTTEMLPITYNAERSFSLTAGSLRRKTPPINMQSLAPSLKDNVILLSPTMEESIEANSDEDSRNTYASTKRSQFASRGNTEYSFGADSGPSVDVRRSPYLVVDNLDEESFTSSGGVEVSDLAPLRTNNQTQHVRLCPTSSDISSLGTATPMRGSLHSFAGTSFADDDA